MAQWVITSGETHVNQPSEGEHKNCGFQCSRVHGSIGSVSRRMLRSKKRWSSACGPHFFASLSSFGGYGDFSDLHRVHEGPQTFAERLCMCDSIFKGNILLFEPECGLVRRLEHNSVGPLRLHVADLSRRCNCANLLPLHFLCSACECNCTSLPLKRTKWSGDTNVDIGIEMPCRCFGRL